MSVEGEAMRPVTWVTIEEVASGKGITTGDIIGMCSAAQEHHAYRPRRQCQRNSHERRSPKAS